MLTKEELPDCPVATTIQLIGNKWKMLIIRNLLEKPHRFKELLCSVPGISKKVLTDNLRALERDGIIIREVYAEVPPKVVYFISPIGDSLRPIWSAMEVWGDEYKNALR